MANNEELTGEELMSQEVQGVLMPGDCVKLPAFDDSMAIMSGIWFSYGDAARTLGLLMSQDNYDKRQLYWWEQVWYLMRHVCEHGRRSWFGGVCVNMCNGWSTTGWALANGSLGV